MALEDLDPKALRGVLVALDLAHALVLDVIRGRGLTQEQVAQVRAAFVAARRTLDALDAAHPWEP